jgi:hypothetical protein
MGGLLMTYALVTSGTVQAESGRIPNAARRLDTQQWVLGLPDAPVNLQQACGWFAVVDVLRPADTATLTYDRSVQLVANVPTVVWGQRLKSQAERDAETTVANRTKIESRARAAIATNLTTIGQIPAGVNQMNAIIADNATNLDVAIDTVALTMKRSLENQERILKQLVALERLLIGSDLLLTDEGTA